MKKFILVTEVNYTQEVRVFESNASSAQELEDNAEAALKALGDEVGTEQDYQFFEMPEPKGIVTL